MERNRFIVCYDIAEPKRLRKVADILEGYGYRIQYSVFECPLSDLQLAELRGEIQETITISEDQVLFISLGGESRDVGLMIESLGLPYTKRTLIAVV